jgi:signal transduction histidine kinase
LSEFCHRLHRLARAHITLVAAISVGIGALIGAFFFLDHYVCELGDEAVRSWRSNELVAIQEGGVLTSIAKTQRIVHSSEILKGVRLDSFGSRLAYAETGERFDVSKMTAPTKEGAIERFRAGFGSYVFRIYVPNQTNVILSFLVRPVYLIRAFWAFVALMVGYFISFAWLVGRYERRDAQIQEQLLLLSLEDFAQGKEPSPRLARSVPRLVSKWADLKHQLKAASEREIQAKINEGLVDVAKQVAHDIRGPLSLLNSMACSGIETEKREMLKSVVSRMLSISQDLLVKSRSNTATRAEAVALLPDGKSPALDIRGILEQTIAEKREEYASRTDIEIACTGDESASLSFVDRVGLERVVLNLLTNAVEALPNGGLVKASVRRFRNFIEIVISDNGIGIPLWVLPQLGAKGATFGKANGNGLGIFQAKRFVEETGGRLVVQSREGVGTQVRLLWPSAKPGHAMRAR